MIKNVTSKDQYLLDLLSNGTANASLDVVDHHRELGHTIVKAGKTTLTDKGRKRAQSLQSMGSGFATMAANAQSGGAPLRTVGGTAFTS